MHLGQDRQNNLEKRLKQENLHYLILVSKIMLHTFTIARTWKQPKCPLTDEWIKKMQHIYTMEYYSAIKRNKTELFVVRQMDLESVIQSEVNQKEKNKYHMLTHIYGIQKIGTDEPSGRAGIKMQTLRTDLRTQGGRGGWDAVREQH